MTRPENLAAVAALRPDFVGLIFYPKSSRYVGTQLSKAELATLPASIRKVGVFVNEGPVAVLARVAELGLDMVQLHGQETPAECAAVQAAGVPVVKAFSVGEEFRFDVLQPYVGSVSYFLFDTKGAQPGGNGTAFDWNLLAAYDLPVPYFLAGGLGVDQAEALRNLRLPGLFALDLNSRFETEPGVKDASLLQKMFDSLRI